MARPSIEITLPAVDVSTADLRAELRRDLGVSIELRRHDAHRTFDDLPEYVVVAAALKPFFDSMLAQWGSAAAIQVSRALHRLRHLDHPNAEPSAGRIVKVVEPTQRITLVFDEEAAVDARAVERMLELQFEALRPRTVLRWDAARGDWRADGRR